MDRFEKFAIAWWVFCTIIFFAFWGGVIYIAWHFLSKYW